MLTNECISFDSHKQIIITLFIMKFKYMTLTDAVKEVVFLRRLALLFKVRHHELTSLHQN